MIDSRLTNEIRESCASALREIEKKDLAHCYVSYSDRVLHAIVDLCDLYDAQILQVPKSTKPEFGKYMFGFLMGSAVIDNAASLRDAVIQLADTLEMHTDLFDTAISACDDTNCVQMFNQFAPSSSHIIKVVWKLDECVYEEPKHDDDDT